jgi:hypothetical protein
MPKGLDGITLKYDFNRGVVNVNDGSSVVEIRFFTESKNYIAPEPRYATVKITPKPVTVEWEDLEFTYDGESHLPKAFHGTAEISIIGAATNAGEYIAEATSCDPNYRVENSKRAFKINKCKNFWITPPGINDFYCGQLPEPEGVGAYGEVSFAFFEDYGLTVPATLPLAPGLYYLGVTIPEGEN